MVSFRETEICAPYSLGPIAGLRSVSMGVITLDPIFSGLVAWSIIFGIVTSTLVTLIVIPVGYWLLYQPPHGNEEPRQGRGFSR
jgi:hypothetical protein